MEKTAKELIKMREEFFSATTLVSKYFMALVRIDPAFGAVLKNWTTTLESLSEISRLKRMENTSKLVCDN